MSLARPLCSSIDNESGASNGFPQWVGPGEILFCVPRASMVSPPGWRGKSSSVILIMLGKRMEGEAMHRVKAHQCSAAQNSSRSARALLLMLLVLIVAVAAGLTSVGSAQAVNTITIVDTLGAATPSTQFSFFGAGGISIFAKQFPGPRFDLTEPTVITEIGGFVDTYALGLSATVEIVPEVSGVPDGAHVIASYTLSSDGDPLTFSYESVSPNLSLPAGTYFALFGVQPGDLGTLLNTFGPTSYLAGLTPAGFLDPTSGASFASPGEFMAVRILGQVTTAAELLANLASSVTGLGPGTSLADKVTTAQSFLTANDIPDVCSTLSAFVNEVNAQTGKTISTLQATNLIASAQQVETLLGC
jgi:hypothetical protein